MITPAFLASRAVRFPALLLLLITGPLTAQAKPLPAPGLRVAALAGQSVPVLPATLVLTDSIPAGTIPATHAALLTWADSIIGEQLVARGPEVTWVLPPEVRHAARRGAGMIPEPDRMGQAVLRSDGLKRIPDPLFAYLRTLAALTDSREIFVPAAVYFRRDSAGVRAELSLVLADARNGAILWRSHPVAVAPTAAEALRDAITIILPDIH